MIYFIGGEFGAVKIGYQKANSLDRLVSLQVACPYKLELLASCEGDRKTEAQLHKQFESARLHGEWFNRTAELEELIVNLRRDTSRPIPIATKYVGTRVPPESWARLRKLSIDLGRGNDSLIAEAIEDVFTKYKA